MVGDLSFVLVFIGASIGVALLVIGMFLAFEYVADWAETTLRKGVVVFIAAVLYLTLTYISLMRGW